MSPLARRCLLSALLASTGALSAATPWSPDIDPRPVPRLVIGSHPAGFTIEPQRLDALGPAHSAPTLAIGIGHRIDKALLDQRAAKTWERTDARRR